MDSQDICLRVLACLVWADGQVTPDERKKFAEFASNAGGLGAPDVIEKYLEADPEITQEEIASLPFDVFTTLLTFSFELVNAERPATSPEEDLLRVIASAQLSPDKIDKAFQWFEHHKKAQILFDEVFDYES
jgi:hypothetical protein